MYIYIYILNIHFFFSLPSGDRPEGCNGGWWWRCDRGTQLPINNNRRRLLLLELSARIPSVGTESCHGKEKNNNAAIEWGRIRNRTNERKYRRKKKKYDNNRFRDERKCSLNKYVGVFVSCEMRFRVMRHAATSGNPSSRPPTMPIQFKIFWSSLTCIFLSIFRAPLIYLMLFIYWRQSELAP